MEATLEKKEKEVKEVKKPVSIPEDTDTMIVRFQNLEHRGIPLEFSAGAPISSNIRNYVLKDGLTYNLGKRLRDHIISLSYPEYKNVPDPNFPDGGVTRSMQSGIVSRFALIPEDRPDIVVYEHLREKLNHKVMPGALTNSSNMPVRVQNSSDVMSEKEQTYMKTENANLARDCHNQGEKIKDLVGALNKLKAENKELKAEK